MRAMSGAVLLLLAACCSVASSAQPLLRGTFRPDCAPYDGPAFSITLPQAASRTQLWMRANVPLAQAAGEWPHVFQAGAGEATIARCQISGEGACSYPEAGRIRVEMPAPDRMRGTIEVTFSGGKREFYRFEARQKLPSQQWFCG
jgi:hypothetical protein